MLLDYTSSSVQNSDKMLIAGLEKNKPRTISKQNKPKNDTLSNPILCASFKKVTFEMLDMLMAARMYHDILGEQHMPSKTDQYLNLRWFIDLVVGLFCRVVVEMSQHLCWWKEIPLLVFSLGSSFPERTILKIKVSLQCQASIYSISWRKRDKCHYQNKSMYVWKKPQQLPLILPNNSMLFARTWLLSSSTNRNYYVFDWINFSRNTSNF